MSASMTVLVFALLVGSKQAAVASTADAVVLSPAPECRVSFAPESHRTRVAKLDEHRIQVSWRNGADVVSTEVRVACGIGDMRRSAEQAGFVQSADGWFLKAGSATERAERISSGSWTGLGATLWAGSACRAVVGESTTDRTYFVLDYCIPDEDYRRNVQLFDSLHEHVSVRRAKP